MAWFGIDPLPRMDAGNVLVYFDVYTAGLRQAYGAYVSALDDSVARADFSAALVVLDAMEAQRRRQQPRKITVLTSEL